MTGIFSKIENSQFNRRSFLKGSAATVSALGLTAYGSSENKLATVAEAAKKGSKEGKWVPAACWFNCGGKCYNAAYVVDNVVVRQKTDDTHPDSPDFPQQRGCLRGRSQQQQIFGADRLKYPMKRKHWKPLTGGDKSLRGKDEWERISWDEAFDYIAAELKQAKEKYGNKSILFPNWHQERFGDVINAYGGHTNMEDSASLGTYHYIHDILGNPPFGGIDHPGYINDRFDLCKSETIVLYGCNPAWASLGSPSYYYLRAKKAGAKFVFVGPDYNESANLLDAKWIRVRPGTDTVFLLAVAYTMIKEDDPVTNPIIDWDFLNRCTVGFDSEHMPADAKLNENFKDYVLGKYDGQPKTPEWATEICGTPVEDIIWYAREMRKDKKVALLHSFAPARGNNAEDFPQIFMTIGVMGGHMGKSGHACGASYGVGTANCGHQLVKHGPHGALTIPNPLQEESISAPEMWDAILTGKYTRTALVNQGDMTSVEERDIDIRVIIHTDRNTLQTVVGVKKGIEAHRKVDFVLSLAYSPNLSAQHADIVLPVTTEWEQLSAHMFMTHTNREMALFYSKVVDPLYDTKSGQEIGEELAKRLGLDVKKIYPKTTEQYYFDCVVGSEVINKEGTGYEPLVTVTEADLAEWGAKYGVKGKTQQGRIGIKELLEKGVYQVERFEGDNYGYIAYEDFVKDPEKFPRPSKSGKFEIYCQTKADRVNAMGRSTLKPYPSYIKVLNGYEDSFKDWDKKEKGKYPYQMYTPHYARRSHTVNDNLPWLREAFTNPVFISAKDAEEKGIKDGDTVLITSPNGKALRHASVTERMMPGCIALPHGTWLDLDEETGIDRSGSDNYLSAPIATGAGTSGYNTNLVNIEKYKGKPLEADYLKPQKVIKF
ncbi:molybdopterin-dependent oxidoreductase [Bacillus massiliigorillae]|uniref:molybdopterin-dependent oxidoreductase n=1 Tax=Bacillus massiliigorillae TaxID=1243664 RepID=UPI0003A21A82|nr:molybdopterin-dependent oxidoreductase [Bacillus massiliigorillae]